MRTPHRVLSYLTTVMAGIALVPAAAFAQEPLKLNVPLRCEDGVTRTITSCAQLSGFIRRMQMAPGRAYTQYTPGITEDSWTRVWRPSSNSSNAAV